VKKGQGEGGRGPKIGATGRIAGTKKVVPSRRGTNSKKWKDAGSDSEGSLGNRIDGFWPPWSKR